jgi:hypothetical protein
MISAILGGLILLFAVLKNLIDDYSTFISYIGVLLAIAIAVGAWLEVQAAGGMDTLRGEIPSSASTASTTTSTSTVTSTQAPEPPPPAPAPPPSEPEAAPPPVEPAPPAEPDMRPEPDEERRDV